MDHQQDGNQMPTVPDQLESKDISDTIETDPVMLINSLLVADDEDTNMETTRDEHGPYPQAVSDPGPELGIATKRITLTPGCSENTLIDHLTSENLLQWGIITRHDGMLCFQFIMKPAKKRRAKTPKVMLPKGLGYSQILFNSTTLGDTTLGDSTLPMNVVEEVFKTPLPPPQQG